jgi:hypothetical protein
MSLKVPLGRVSVWLLHYVVHCSYYLVLYISLIIGHLVDGVIRGQALGFEQCEFCLGGGRGEEQ